MSYVILLVTLMLLLAMAFYIISQWQKTAQIRQDLHEARRNKILNGLHSLRGEK